MRLVTLAMILATETVLAAPQPATPQAVAPQPAAKPASPAPQPVVMPLVPPLVPIDQTQVPQACQPLAKQALAPNTAAALAARVSLATCMADRAVAPLALCDCGESVLAVDAAVAPALALLDNVIEVGDPASQVIAEHAEGALYAGFSARLLATLPKVAPGAPDAEVALRDLRKQTLEAQLAPWREAAMTAFQHVVDIAKAHPEMAAHNSAVATALRDSQQRLAAEVANR
jgi:hypothetical protein